MLTGSYLYFRLGLVIMFNYKNRYNYYVSWHRFSNHGLEPMKIPSLSTVPTQPYWCLFFSLLGKDRTPLLRSTGTVSRVNHRRLDCHSVPRWSDTFHTNQTKTKGREKIWSRPLHHSDNMTLREICEEFHTKGLVDGLFTVPRSIFTSKDPGRGLYYVNKPNLRDLRRKIGTEDHSEKVCFKLFLKRFSP